MLPLNKCLMTNPEKGCLCFNLAHETSIRTIRQKSRAALTKCFTDSITQELALEFKRLFIPSPDR